MDNTNRQKTVTKTVTGTHGQRIATIPEGGAIVIEKIPNGGSLEARRLRSGSVAFYWRHTQGGRTERAPIGVYDPSAPPKALTPSRRGYSIAAGLEKARELSKLNRDTPGGLRAERARLEAIREAADHARAIRAKFTLRGLCDGYCDWLKKQGKPSHVDARGIFENHLLAPFPALADSPANETEKRQIVSALRRLTEAGKTTTARKLRSYLRAAYACALKADSDATLPAAFIDYKVENNPVEATSAIKGQSDKNPLSLDDMRRYWKTIKGEPGVIGAALRLHLLSGGQRTAQLVRLKDADLMGDSFRLFDSKGKRDKPREHLVPVNEVIRDTLAELPAKGFILSTDGGTTPMHPTSLSTWAADVAARAEIDDFQLKRVRSGVETMLAQAGIPLHIRGQLQSHGIGGVQERHYDAHQYLPEKRHALAALKDLLDHRPARNVAPLRLRAR